MIGQYRSRYSIAESLHFLSEDINLYGGGDIVGGDNGHINQGTVIQAYEGCHVMLGRRVRIGRYVSILTRTQIADQDFNKPSKELECRMGNVVIGDFVWIASHSVIMPGVTIGENAVVRCYSYVDKDVPAYAVVSGQPAAVQYLKECRHDRL